MIPLSEATAHVLDRCAPLPTETRPLDDAMDAVLAVDIASSEAVPPFDNTAMDGFALQAADTVGAPVTLEVVGTVAAGSAGDVTVGPGQAARIMTGAPMPPGADAVVMVERTTFAAEAAEVEVELEVPVGNHLRRAGEDVAVGDVVFTAGSLLTPAHIGVLASLGNYEVDVGRRPVVGVCSTGDELIDDGRPLERGQIRDSNRHTLVALLRRHGCGTVDLGIAADDPGAIESTLREGLESCDAILTSGGVSMGDFDYVKVVLDEIADMRWMQIAIKPAKPFAFGLVGSTPIFGLPGNPVSSMVSFELFAKPALRKMMGHNDPGPQRVRGRAAVALDRRPDAKTHFLRVAASPGSDGVLEATSAGGQGSHQLTAMAAANTLAEVPDGDGIAAGAPVDLIVL